MRSRLSVSGVEFGHHLAALRRLGNATLLHTPNITSCVHEPTKPHYTSLVQSPPHFGCAADVVGLGVSFNLHCTSDAVTADDAYGDGRDHGCSGQPLRSQWMLHWLHGSAEHDLPRHGATGHARRTLWMSCMGFGLTPPLFKRAGGWRACPPATCPARTSCPWVVDIAHPVLLA